MSIDFALYGATTDSVRLKARCNANGVVTLIGDLTGSATADTSVNDGVVEFNFSGLTSGRVYHCTLEQGGTVYPYELKLRPLRTDQLKIVFWSCITDLINSQWKFLLLLAEAPDLTVCLGDFIYADTTSYTVNGITTTKQCSGPTTAGYNTHRRAVMSSSEFKALAAVTPQYIRWDDHEIIDGWCGGINQVNWLYHSGYPGAVELATTQAQVDAIYAAARASADIYDINPLNTDADIDADALYFGVRVGNLCEIVVPDLLTYSTVNAVFNGAGYTEERPTYSASDASASKMGATQKAWWKARLAAAQADGVYHKITLSQKKLYPNSGSGAEPNNDSYDWYRVEREELVDWADANLTGHGFGTGDDHELSVARNAKMFMVNACALNSGPFHQGAGYTTPIVWKKFGASGAPGTTLGKKGYGYGVITLTPERQVWQIKNADLMDADGTGMLEWQGINDGTNNLLIEQSVRTA